MYLFWNQLYTLNPGGQMMEIKVQVNASLSELMHIV